MHSLSVCDYLSVVIAYRLYVSFSDLAQSTDALRRQNTSQKSVIEKNISVSKEKLLALFARMTFDSTHEMYPLFQNAINFSLWSVEMSGFGILVAVFFVFVTTVLLRFYGSQKEFKTQLYYRKTRLSIVLLKRCQKLKEAFQPTFWASNCHVQTILSLLLPNDKVEFSREYLQMNDKGVVGLDWVVVDELVLTKASPIIVIVADATSKAADFSGLCSLAIKKKFRPVFFNRRGQGGTPLTTPRLQSFSEPGDLEEALTFIKSMFPCAEVTAIGCSTGSGLLVSYLGALGNSTSFTAVVCISPIYDTEGLFKKPFPQPYDLLFTWKLKQLFLRHPCLSNVVDFDSVLQSRTVKELHERVYAKLNKYNSLDEYWKYNNPMRNIASVSIPVLCINALDDPICPKETIPFSLFKTSSNFFLVTTEKGGHCGFFENTIPSSWAYKVSLEYLESVVQQGVRKTNSNLSYPHPEDNHINLLDKYGPRARSYTT